MKSTEARDLTWQDIRGKMAGTREVIHAWLLSHGPATTEGISLGTGIGLLTVRPRVSELCAWGFAKCIGREKHEGIYQAVTVSDAQRLHETSAREGQLNLKLQ
jgi:hypothetical protein